MEKGHFLCCLVLGAVFLAGGRINALPITAGNDKFQAERDGNEFLFGESNDGSGGYISTPEPIQSMENLTSPDAETTTSTETVMTSSQEFPTTTEKSDIIQEPSTMAVGCVLPEGENIVYMADSDGVQFEKFAGETVPIGMHVRIRCAPGWRYKGGKKQVRCDRGAVFSHVIGVCQPSGEVPASEEPEIAKTTLTTTTTTTITEGPRDFLLELFEAAAKGDTQSMGDVILNHNHSNADVNDISDKTDPPNTPLLVVVAMRNQPAAARVLIRQGADVDNARPSDQMTPVMAACERGSMEALRAIFEDRQPDLEKKTSTEQTALQIAVKNNQREAAKFLLGKGAEQTWCSTSEECQDVLKEIESDKMLNSVIVGDIAAINVALQKGANIDYAPRTKTGDNTALMTAVLRDDRDQDNGIEVVEYILSKGAAIDKQRQSDMRTALHLAIELGRSKIANFLIEKGADVNLKNTQDKDALKIAELKDDREVLEKIIESDRADDLSTCSHELCRSALTKKQFLKLAAAVSDNQIEKVDDILKVINSEVVNECDLSYQEGKTALLSAVSLGYEPIVKLLLEEGKADVDKTACSDTVSKTTPLHEAARLGHHGIVKLLLQYKANVAAFDQSGENALSLALKNKHEEVVEELLANGADCPPAKTTNDYCQIKWRNAALSNLMKAVREDNVENVEKLLARGIINVDETSENVEDGKSALIVAAEIGTGNLIDVLIAKGANVNKTAEKTMKTPMLAAVEAGHQEVVRLLSRNDANLNSMTVDGNCALHLAVKNNHVDIWREFVELNATKLECVDESCLLPDKTIYEQILRDAIKNNNVPTFKLLRQQGALKEDSSLGESLLFDAVESGNLDFVVLLLETVDVNAKLGDGSTALMKAVERDNQQIVDLLIKNKADINAKNSLGESAVDIAVKKRLRGTAKLLKDGGADISACMRKQCFNILDIKPGVVLKKALEENNIVVIETMAKEFKAEFAAIVVDDEGNTPIEFAIKNNKTDIFYKLLTVDGAKDAAEKAFPLALKQEVQDDEMISALIEAGANIERCQHHLCAKKWHQHLVEAAESGNVGELQKAITNGAKIDHCDPDFRGKTAFSLALNARQNEIVKYLLSIGANPDTRACSSVQGLVDEEPAESQLFVAINKGLTDVAKELIDRLTADSLKSSTASNGDSVLIAAARKDDEELVKYLLEKGADSSRCRLKCCLRVLKLKEFHEMSQAIAKNDIIIVKQMLADGFDLKMRDESIRHGTVIHVAVMHNKPDVVKELLESGANVNEKTTRTKETGMHFAAERHHVAMIKFLKEHGADVEARDHRNYTPLMMATVAGRLRTIRALINVGARVDVKNEKGETPIIMSALGAHVNVLKLLLTKPEARKAIDDKDKEGRTAYMRAAEFGEKGDWWQRDEAIKTMLVLLEHQASAEGCNYNICEGVKKLFEKLHGKKHPAESEPVF